MKRLQGKRNLALAAVAVAAMAAAVVMFMLDRRQSDQAAFTMPSIAPGAVMSLKKVHHRATKNGAPQWELDAETASLEDETGHLVLTNPKVRFFLEDGADVVLTADRGMLDTRKNDIKATGNVRVANSRYTLTTEMLAYIHETRLLLSEQPVRIIGPAGRLRSTTMTYDLNANIILFKGDVKGRLDDAISL